MLAHNNIHYALVTNNIPYSAMATPRRELSYGSVQIYHREVLGSGCYGMVFKAKYGQLHCAAKMILDIFFQDNDPGLTRNLVTKFLQECQFLSTIKHPSIVQHLGTVTDPQSQRPVLLMELMDESLTRFLRRSAGPIPYHSQLNICHDVASALAYLHSNAIIHRDLSSNNVLLIGEGNRAKVADFGMAKLMDIPRMTPLTQAPGTPPYMPPEALISPPHYSSKLDCFSHGVLTLQILTRNFPSPGDASRYVEDPRYLTGRVLVQFPEAERRKKDIDLIEPSHPLRPIALHCLKDRDTERPSADELCGRLASLKREPRYTHSVEQTKERTHRLQEEISTKDAELDRARAELQKENESKEWFKRSVQELSSNLQEKEKAVEQVRELIQVLQEEIFAKNAELERAKRVEQERDQRLQEEIGMKNAELERAKHELRRANKEKKFFQRIVLKYRSNLQEGLENVELLCSDYSMKSISQSSRKSITLRDNPLVLEESLAKRPTHQELFDALKPIRNEWKMLGFNLNCDYPSLENIETKERDAGNRLLAMTALVLRRGDVDWKQVIQAVEEVGYESQAQTITQKVTASHQKVTTPHNFVSH